MSPHAWSPLDPEGLRPPEPSGREQGPDPEPIVRTVRIAFLLAGMLVVLLADAALHPFGAGPARSGAGPAVTAAVAAVVLAVVGLAARALRPARLLLAGKRALLHPDPRQARPAAERARAIGFRGLALGWAAQAMLLGLVPAFAGLALALLHRTAWEPLVFAALSLLAGLLYQREVTDAVRLAVDDPELRASYGSR